MQILYSHQEGYTSTGVFEEYGVSRLAEYAIAASAYAVVVFPECAPAVVGFAEKAIPYFQNYSAFFATG